MTDSTQIFERVASLVDEYKLINLLPQISACRNGLYVRNGIDVAVFGRFKAGKSSFLNDLTGRAVLPIGVVPLTAIITRLRAGETERATVQFLSGATKAISLSEIRLYVGEDENPNNAKQVAAVEAELPELKPLAPLQFVDTPGLGSTFTHNTEVALNWLPNVGAALVAVSTDAPLSERDLNLLEELRRHTPKIVLLLTKADLLTEAQRAEVLNFVRRQLQQKWNGGLPVYFYSVLPSLSDFKTTLRDELLLPLLRNRDVAGGEILRHKLASLVGQTSDYLRLAHAAATQAQSARTALREKLADERRQFDMFRAELNALTRQWSANALDWYLSELLFFQRDLQRKTTTELRAQFPQWKMRLPPMVDAWRAWLDIFLQREMSEVSRVKQAMFCEPLHKARTHLTRTLTAFHDRLAAQVKAALGVTLTPREFSLEVREPKAPPVDVAFAFDPAFTTLGWIIPLTIFRRPIERNLLRKARWEVEKNLSRLASDWRDRITEGIGELTRQAEQQALDELAALEQTLNQSASKAPELKKALDELEQFQKQLHE